MTAKTSHKPNTEWVGIYDQIHARQSQLEALLTATTISEGGEEGFYGALSPSQQANYMSACCDMSVEIGRLTRLLVRALNEGDAS